VACDFERNRVRYERSTAPSSESLTHAAIYASDALDRVPTTSKAIAYGTPEMAYEIMRLFTVSDVRSREIFVMAGHEGGIVTFGKNLEDAFDVVMRERRESSPCI
jgi:ribulose-5-phosphate 4-epimerase/fuculose-1-phosphate aldolase